MKLKITDRWFVPQVLEFDGKWMDVLDNDLSRKEARACLTMVECAGHKARIIERVAAFRVVSTKDFTNAYTKKLPKSKSK